MQIHLDLHRIGFFRISGAIAAQELYFSDVLIELGNQFANMPRHLFKLWKGFLFYDDAEQNAKWVFFQSLQSITITSAFQSAPKCSPPAFKWTQTGPPRSRTSVGGELWRQRERWSGSFGKRELFQGRWNDNTGPFPPVQQGWKFLPAPPLSDLKVAEEVCLQVVGHARATHIHPLNSTFIATLVCEVFLLRSIRLTLTPSVGWFNDIFSHLGFIATAPFFHINHAPISHYPCRQVLP